MEPSLPQLIEDVSTSSNEVEGVAAFLQPLIATMEFPIISFHISPIDPIAWSLGLLTVIRKIRLRTGSSAPATNSTRSLCQ